MLSRTFKAVWHHWLRSRGHRGRSSGARKQQARFLPYLEPLENRSVPAVLSVNSVADNMVRDNVLTLREAIALVDNGNVGRALTTLERAQVKGTLGKNDIIQFQLPSGHQIIKLTGGPLSITKPVTIIGPGAESLTISGNNQSRVFVVGKIYSRNLNLSVTITGITITGGRAVSGLNNYGGGLLNFGTLTLSNMTFTGNAAGSGGGGAIYNDGTLTVNNSIFSGNTAAAGASGTFDSSGAKLTVNNTVTPKTTGGQSMTASDTTPATITGTKAGAVVSAPANTLSVITDPNAAFSVPIVARPGYLQPVADPVLGTQITRIAGNANTPITVADGTTLGNWGLDARHNYNLNEAWNNNSTLIYIENPPEDGGSPDQLYLDGNTYQVKFGTPSNMPGDGGDDQRWNPNPSFPDDVILAGKNSNQLYWFNVVNNTIDRTWTLPLAVTYIGNTKGNPSQAGQFICLGNLTQFFIVDMDSYPTQRIGPVFDLSTLGINGTVDSYSVSPSGDFVVVHYSMLNGQAGDFEQVLKVDPTTLALTPQPMSVSWPGLVGNPALGFVYQLGHEDMALDPFLNNAAVMIGQEHCGNVGLNIPGIPTVNSDGIGGIVMVQLSNGAVTSLTDPGNGKSIANEAYPDHVSCRAILRPGWCYVSYYNEPGDRYTDEIIAVKMDGSGSVEQLADYHSDFDDNTLPEVSQDLDFGYRSEAHPVPSPDGMRVIFASNWLYQGTGGEWIDDYVIDLRQAQPKGNSAPFALASVADYMPADNTLIAPRRTALVDGQSTGDDTANSNSMTVLGPGIVTPVIDANNPNQVSTVGDDDTKDWTSWSGLTSSK
jgi:hypothetical protein